MTTCPHSYSTHALEHQKHDKAQADKIKCMATNIHCPGTNIAMATAVTNKFGFL